MATLFDRTGFNFIDTSGTIAVLPNTAIQQMNAAPALVSSQWMKDDLVNNDITGYYKNPVANSCNTIWNTANTLWGIANNLQGVANTTALWTTIYTTLGNIVDANTEMVQFINHTNRISGVVPITANTDAANKPCLEQAMQIGRALTYLIYQVDGREDNAPMLGSFTSILVANTISDYANTIVTYPNTINASITVSTSGTPPDPVITTNTSNLTYNTVNSIAEFANTLYTLLHDRRVHDENFYTTSNELVSEARSIRRYSSLGVSEDSLVQNFIGTDKLKSRLANQ
jgi:hypothetical protein